MHTWEGAPSSRALHRTHPLVALVFSEDSPPTTQSRSAKRRIKLDKAEPEVPQPLTLDDLRGLLSERNEQRDEARRKDMQKMEQMMGSILEALKK